MARYHFTSNGHKVEINLDDSGTIIHDGQPVTDVDKSYLHEGGFRVVEDGDECNYEWKVESKGLFSNAQVHTVRRNGEIVLEVEIP